METRQAIPVLRGFRCIYDAIISCTPNVSEIRLNGVVYRIPEKNLKFRVEFELYFRKKRMIQVQSSIFIEKVNEVLYVE